MSYAQIRTQNRDAGKAWANHSWPIGVRVRVRRDNGDQLETVTRSEPWQTGDGTWIVLVEGISGGYALERVTVHP